MEIDTPIIEFFQLIYSKEGQESVARDGFMPLSEILAVECRKLIEQMNPNAK